MSIREIIDYILDDDTFLIKIFFIFLLTIIIVLPICLLIGKKQKKEIYGDGKGVVFRAENTKIVSKKCLPHPANSAVSVYYVLFEFLDGGRIELAIEDRQVFGLMAEGDIGTLEYAGITFIDFYR